MGSAGSSQRQSAGNRNVESCGVHTAQKACGREDGGDKASSSSSFSGDLCLASDQNHLLILGKDFLREYASVADNSSLPFFSSPASLHREERSLAHGHQGSSTEEQSGARRQKKNLSFPSPLSREHNTQNTRHSQAEEGDQGQPALSSSCSLLPATPGTSSVHTPETSFSSSSSSPSSFRSEDLTRPDADVVSREENFLREKNAFLITLKKHLAQSLMEEIASVKDSLKSCPLTAAAVSSACTLAETVRSSAPRLSPPFPPTSDTTKRGQDALSFSRRDWQESSVKKGHQANQPQFSSALSLLPPSSCYEEQVQVWRCYRHHAEKASGKKEEEERKGSKEEEGGRDLLKCRDAVADLRQCSEKVVGKKPAVNSL